VANADNVGGVFRNAAAFGAGAVLLGPACCDPFYRKAIRTSMAATLRIPFARLEPWPDALESLRADGFAIVALTPDPSARSIGEFHRHAPSGRLALLFGSEGSGLTGGAQALADERVRIPIQPAVDSLNLAVASGIALSWLTSADLLA
jgi:tRNA G18 (ribose-2'-O)-methylase SpoU